VSRCIVYTRRDGGVNVFHPSPRTIRRMASGGLWAHMPRGFIDAQIERKIARGMLPDAARRLCLALAFGGASTAEAYGILRDATCGHRGVAHELWDTADLPADRRYRDAWRRSSNGGPIWLDERKAMAIDEARAWRAYERSRPRMGASGSPSSLEPPSCWR
jgi:hypothetical protein